MDKDNTNEDNEEDSDMEKDKESQDEDENCDDEEEEELIKIMAEENRIEEEVVTMISEETRPELTEFTTIANTYNILNPKSPPIKIEYDSEGDIIIDYNYDPTYENSILYMCQFCPQTCYSKTKLRTHKNMIHPSTPTYPTLPYLPLPTTTTPTPEPEPPDPHFQATQALQEQIPKIRKILGLPTI